MLPKALENYTKFATTFLDALASLKPVMSLTDLSNPEC